MCVNDVLAQGAEPLFFLDYIATGHNDPEKLAQVVHGVAEGCKQSGSALIGGETAEMPDMYPENEYDLAGFSVGIANKEALLNKNLAQKGDVLIGLPSTGIHSNGFSLVRKILFKDHNFEVTDKPAELEGKSLGEALLTPTKIYVKAVLPLVKKQLLHGIAHITGGGLIENLPRTYNNDLQAEVNVDSWPLQSIFKYLMQEGQLNQHDCLNTFNMGIGLVLLVAEKNVMSVEEQLKQENEQYYKIGQLKKRPDGEDKIIFNGDF
jgi:phosphoribosylformylglycinamidine cyclo-ligase